MELPLGQPRFCTLLLLVLSNLLLWEEASSIPACLAEEGGCWDPLVETFNSAIQRAETLHNLAEQFYVELSSKLIRQDKTVVRAGTYCHSTLTNLPNKITDPITFEFEDYFKILIYFVGSWISPLYHLVIELSAMQDVPETILSKAKEIEDNNRQLLDDLRWILAKVNPTTEMPEEFPRWEHHSFLKSSGKYYKFLAMFNLFNCLEHDTKYTLFHLRILKCPITGKDC